ncbi:MAG: RsmD family RNA methyltransferase [Planctomycetota bacterium]
MSKRGHQLKIIAGELKSRYVESPPDASTTRPLPVRVRESIFGLLRGHIEGERVVDVFAGTGSFSFEAVSRGASEAVLVEKDRSIAKLIARTIEKFGVEDRAQLINADALGASTPARVGEPAHIIMMDPPYPLMTDKSQRERVLQAASKYVELLDDEGYLILRTPWKDWVYEGKPATPHAAERIDEHEVEVDEAGLPLDGSEDEPAEQHKAAREPGNLKIEGAIGPETHEYGSTAVHLYMRES